MRVLKILPWLMLVLVVSISTGCTKGDSSNAWEMINNGALLVDVRTQGEFNDGHLPNAKLIPINQVEQRIAEFGEDKDRKIVLYCKAGVRAAKAETILKNNGYTQVFNAGGYKDLMAIKP